MAHVMIVDDDIVENPEFFLVSVFALDSDAEFEQDRDEAIVSIVDNDGKNLIIGTLITYDKVKINCIIEKV